MAKTYFCWRCQIELPMLDEQEWAEVSPFLENRTANAKSYRDKHGVGMKEALRNGADEPALEIYEKLTGFKETNVLALYHHRLSLYGPECPSCGKLIRTSRARFCAECGMEVALT